MNTDTLTAFIIGIITSLIAMIVASLIAKIVRKRSAKWRTMFQLKFLRRDEVIQGLKDLLEQQGFQSEGNFKFTPFQRHPCYYHRALPRNNDSNLQRSFNNELEPIFLYFSNSHYQLRAFKAFLIPQIDYGHINRGDDHSNLHPLIGYWKKYIHGLNELAKSSLASDKSRKFCRLIIINKQLINLYWSEAKFIEEWATKGEQTNLTKFAKSVKKYVSNVISIHEALSGSKSIECLYIDKSLFAANQYYDFGLYDINGIEVVYNPVYNKGPNRHVMEEQVVIAESKKQKEKLDSFAKDFDCYWAMASEIASGGKIEFDELEESIKDIKMPTNCLPQNKINEISKHLDKLDKEAFQFADFERSYVTLIRKIQKIYEP